MAAQEVEAEQAASDGLVAEPFLILAALGSPDTTGLLAQARARREPGDAQDRELEALAAGLGSADLLQVPRTTLATGWRDTPSRSQISLLSMRAPGSSCSPTMAARSSP